MIVWRSPVSLKGVRPKSPKFATTCGYTEELWEMTTSCWKEDPSCTRRIQKSRQPSKKSSGDRHWVAQIDSRLIETDDPLPSFFQSPLLHITFEYDGGSGGQYTNKREQVPTEPGFSVTVH